MLYTCIYADGEGADVVRQAFWNYMKSPRSKMNEQQLVTPYIKGLLHPDLATHFVTTQWTSSIS